MCSFWEVVPALIVGRPHCGTVYSSRWTCGPDWVAGRWIENLFTSVSTEPASFYGDLLTIESIVIPPGRIMGDPPCSTIRSRRPKVNAFGLLALPKNSTQNAGSNENEANEFACGMEAFCAVLGIESLWCLA